MESDEFTKYYNHYMAEQKMIISDLEEQCVFVTDIYQELPRNKADWKKATPVLIEWMPKVTNDGLKEAVIRLLCVPWLKGDPVGGTLMNMAFDQNVTHNLRWVIGNTMSVIADDSFFDDIKRLVSDQTFGSSRQMYVLSLGKMKKTPEAIPLLISLLDQDDVTGHAISALKSLNAVEAIEDVRRFVDHPRTWIRNAAKKTVAKFEKILEKKG